MKKNLINKKKNQKGFTLVELIVVVAIIGVLVAMMVPSLIGYVNKAKIQKNNSNARTIASTVQASNGGLDVPLKAPDKNGISITATSNGWDITGLSGAPATALKTDLDKMLTVNGSARVYINEEGTVTQVIYSTDKKQAPTSESESNDTIGVWAAKPTSGS